MIRMVQLHPHSEWTMRHARTPLKPCVAVAPSDSICFSKNVKRFLDLLGVFCLLHSLTSCSLFVSEFSHLHLTPLLHRDGTFGPPMFLAFSAAACPFSTARDDASFLAPSRRGVLEIVPPPLRTPHSCRRGAARGLRRARRGPSSPEYGDGSSDRDDVPRTPRKGDGASARKGRATPKGRWQCAQSPKPENFPAHSTSGCFFEALRPCSFCDRWVLNSRLYGSVELRSPNPSASVPRKNTFFSFFLKQL